MVATFVTGEAASLPLGDSSAEVALSAFGVVSRISFAAASARDYLDAKFRNHPLSVIARPILQPRGEVEAVTERALAILEAASEDPNSFRSTSSYVAATARRPLDGPHGTVRVTPSARRCL